MAVPSGVLVYKSTAGWERLANVNADCKNHRRSDPRPSTSGSHYWIRTSGTQSQASADCGIRRTGSELALWPKTTTPARRITRPRRGVETESTRDRPARAICECWDMDMSTRTCTLCRAGGRFEDSRDV